jgi:hypothetical protein
MTFEPNLNGNGVVNLLNMFLVVGHTTGSFERPSAIMDVEISVRRRTKESKFGFGQCKHSAEMGSKTFRKKSDQAKVI